MILEHILVQWVKKYTIAHLKLREPIHIGCITYDIVTIGNDSKKLC